MNAAKLVGLGAMPFFASPIFAKKNAECLSAEEEAAELQRIMQGAPGEAPPTREDMMEILMARQKGKKLPEFARFTGPLMMITPRRSTGLIVEFGIPLSQRFQPMFTYSFSNKEESEFEFQGMYFGSGS
jgi:hypothetical protein